MSVTLNSLKRLTYRPKVVATARLLRLHKVLRWLYLHWAAPSGVVEIGVSEIQFSLYAKTAEEVRDLEGTTISEGIAWSEKHTLETFLGFIQAGDVVYDVGANFGLYSVALGKSVGDRGQIIAFEPLGRNYDRLQANIRLNGLKNVEGFQKALGEENLNAQVYVDVEHPWCATLLKRSARNIPQTVEIVEVVGGDAFRIAQGLRVPRAVKVDVEGYEYSVIRGLRQTLSDPRCEFLACEVHPHLLPSGITSEDVFGLLRSLGFARMDVRARGTEFHVFCYKC